jgi:SpoVK/Ycf46/Vps4 family AAA+-type ATPase
MLPFEQLIIFSTNLNPKDLVDDAFLRRIKHKIRIDPPTKEQYAVIFELVCRQRNIPYDREIVESLYRTYYDQGRTARSSDPRDLIDMAMSISRFREQSITLTNGLIDECARRFFGEI